MYVFFHSPLKAFQSYLNKTTPLSYQPCKFVFTYLPDFLLTLFVTQLVLLQNINSYKIGQCYPTTYQNDSFHKLVFEEMDNSLAVRPRAVEGFRKVMRVLTFGDSEDQGEDPQVVFLQSILRLWSAIPNWSIGETGCKE